MSKLPNWFKLEDYKKELTQMDWAFEIFIRLYTDEKLIFILNNHPFSDSPDRNALYFLSCTIPSFNFDEAVDFVARVKNNAYEEILSRFDPEQAQNLRENPDSRLELIALDKSIRRFRNSTFRYIDFLGSLPIHVLFNQAEKQHLQERFNHAHKTIKPAPLIFPEQESFKYYRKGHRKENVGVTQPQVHTSRSINPARPFRVNLAFSDKEILSAVEQYLKEIRHTQVIGRHKLIKKLPSWKTNHVLAIRDLTEWGDKFMKTKFTYAEIANAVWPPFAAGNEKIIDYAERVRKTSLPDIQEAFTEMTYGLLLDTGIQPE